MRCDRLVQSAQSTIDGALDHRLLVSEKMFLMVHRVVYFWHIHTHTHAVCGGHLDDV